MPDQITPEELREVLAYCDAAAEGPWHFYQIGIHGGTDKAWFLDADSVCRACGQDDGSDQIAEFDDGHEASGIFCKRSRTDLPRFAKALEAAYAREVELEKIVPRLVSAIERARLSIESTPGEAARVTHDILDDIIYALEKEGLLPEEEG